MNDEKYEVSLEINTNKFNKQCDDIERRAMTMSDKIANALKSDYTTELFNDDMLNNMSISGLEKELTVQAGRLDTVKERMARGFDNLFDERLFEAKKDIYISNITLIENKLRDLGVVAEETKGDIGNVGEEIGGSKFKSFFNVMDKGFERGFKKAKRFTLGLLGVRSAYFGMHKAMSNYLQNDQELSDKLQSIWTALGVVMAPIVEFIADLVLKVSKYVLYIAQAITGVDLLQRAMEKTQKKMNKSLSSIDEITNVAEQSNLTTLADMLDKVEIDTDWADKLARALKPVYDMIKGIIDFSIEHPEVIAAILGGWAVMNLISNIIGSPTAGLIGITATLAILAGMSIANLIDEIKEYKKQLDSLNDQSDGQVELNKKWSQSMIKAYEEGKLKGDELESVISRTEKSIQRTKDQLDEARKNNFFGERDQEISNYEESIKIMGQTLETITGKPYEIKIEATLDDTKFTNGVNHMGTTLSDKIGGFVDWTFGGFKEHSLGYLIKNYSKRKLNSYDVGTNYVPNDQLAMVHEGEAIVPKKFNSQEFFGNNTDSETKDMLFEIIDLLRENGDKVPVFNMDSREFARATYEAYQNEGKRLGVNTSIERS